LVVGPLDDTLKVVVAPSLVESGWTFDGLPLVL